MTLLAQDGTWVSHVWQAPCWPPCHRSGTPSPGSHCCSHSPISHAGAPAFQPIYFWGHRNASRQAVFVKLVTNSSRLRLTPDHFIPACAAGACQQWADFENVAARRVRAGHSVLLHQGKGAASQPLSAAMAARPPPPPPVNCLQGVCASCAPACVPTPLERRVQMVWLWLPRSWRPAWMPAWGCTTPTPQEATSLWTPWSPLVSRSWPVACSWRGHCAELLMRP